MKINLTLEELRKRTSKEYLKTVNFLSAEDNEYKSLSAREKLVLKHLTRAAYYFEQVHYKQENAHNEKFFAFLDKEIAKGDEKAMLTKKLFMAQKSIFSPDREGNKVVLLKDAKEPISSNFYPEDLTIEDFHKILNTMLDDGETQEVRKIVSQRTMVVRNGAKLAGIDYVDYFKKEFQMVAAELETAMSYCDDEKFKNFLEKQILALRTADENLDAAADKLWAELDGTSNLEFTIARECYGDIMTESIQQNKELMARLDQLKIEVLSKDCLGARVGIVNKEGTAMLDKLSAATNIARELMPYKSEYENKVGSRKGQTAVDVDVICLTGEEGACKGGIVTAQNLPNNYQPSIKIGGGRRNVYHRQVRQSPANTKWIKTLLTEDGFKYFDVESCHLGVILHENTHSIGPSPKTLGKYSSMIEELKADMGMFAFLPELTKEGVFTETESKQIIVSELVTSVLKGMPLFEQAHRVRTVIILNKMLEDKALKLIDSKLHVDFDKVVKTSKDLMALVVRMQLDADIVKTEELVEKYFKWTDDLNEMAKVRKMYDTTLNFASNSSLAQKFIKPKASEKNIDLLRLNAITTVDMLNKSKAEIKKEQEKRCACKVCTCDELGRCGCKKKEINV